MVLAKDKVQEMEALISWLKDKWGDPECPLCSGNDWKIQSQVFMTIENLPTIISNGNGIYVVPVSCCDCGYMMFLNKRIVKEQMESE